MALKMDEDDQSQGTQGPSSFSGSSSLVSLWRLLEQRWLGSSRRLVTSPRNGTSGVENLYKILSLKPSHKLITKPIPDASSIVCEVA